MYGSIVGGTTAGGAAGAGALAATGMNTLAEIVAAATLITAGLAVKKIIYRRRTTT